MNTAANENTRIKLIDNIKQNAMRYFSLSTLLILIILFTILSPNFLNIQNLGSAINAQIPMMMMAAGMTSVLLIGSIDLSVGQTCTVSNVLFVTLLIKLSPYMDLSSATIISIICVLGFGVLSGALVGLLNVKLKLPSFIATLAMMSIWKTVALIINPKTEQITNEMRPSIAWGKVPIFEVFTVAILFFIALIVVLYILQSRTVYGKAVYAIGSNERVARIAGISVDSVKMRVFIMAGLCTSIAGIFLSVKMQHSSPTIGDAFTLPVIASVVLGGTSLSGGRGSILLTVLGSISVSFINNGMNVVGIDVLWQNIIFGGILLGAVSLAANRDKNIIIK